MAARSRPEAEPEGGAEQVAVAPDEGPEADAGAPEEDPEAEAAAPGCGGKLPAEMLG